MSMEGNAHTEYASLSGHIKTFVIDKTLSISGACADAKATGDAIENLTESAKDEAAKYAVEKSLEAVKELAETAADNSVKAQVVALTVDEVKAICV